MKHLREKVTDLENIEDIIGNSEAMKKVLHEVSFYCTIFFISNYYRRKRNR